jgi:hypothetical protein
VVRTTLDIDEDVLRAAKSIARAQETSLGRVVSNLARKGLAPKSPNRKREFPVFRIGPGAPPMSEDMIRRAEEDDE